MCYQMCEIITAGCYPQKLWRLRSTLATSFPPLLHAALRFDPFNAQKTAAWAKSAGAAADLAAEAQRVGQAVQQGSTAAQQDQSKLKDSLFSVLQVGRDCAHGTFLRKPCPPTSCALDFTGSLEAMPTRRMAPCPT